MHLFVFVAVYQCALRLNEIYIFGKLLAVDVESGEDVDVVPLDASDYGHVGVIEMEFGPAVDGRSEVLVALDDHHLGGVAQSHHHVKAFQLCANHIVGLYATMGKHVQYHCRGGCLAVRAADDDAQLVLRLLVKVFGITVYLQPKLLGFKQFGIVSACVHTKNHSVEVGGDAFRVPAFFLGQQPCVLQTRAGRIEDFVVRACDGISFLVQRYDSGCQIV